MPAATHHRVMIEIVVTSPPPPPPPPTRPHAIFQGGLFETSEQLPVTELSLSTRDANELSNQSGFTYRGFQSEDY